MPPMRAAAENSDAVLPSIENRYSVSGRLGSYCVRSSAIWPSTSRPMVGAEQAGDLGAQAGGDLGGPGQQEVARQDGPQVAPAGVHAGHRAAHLGLVHHVVVVERAEVDELHRHAAADDVVAGLVAGR